ncbi:hypothetical protein ABOC32_15755 [Pseudomonas sp. WOUb67]|uniref:hypothetical protein n=1 Tax=Pseudomonas sp. WOUb67 TaxID=3161136 RepID=UPI003CE8D10A
MNQLRFAGSAIWQLRQKPSIGTGADGELDRIAGMACHGGHSIGSLVYRFAPSETTHGGLLLLHRQQPTVVGVGLAG